jgi:hypothetical protein
VENVGSWRDAPFTGCSGRARDPSAELIKARGFGITSANSNWPLRAQLIVCRLWIILVGLFGGDLEPNLGEMTWSGQHLLFKKFA